MLEDLLPLWPLLLLVLLATLLSEWAIKSGYIAYWLGRKVLHFLAVGACALAPWWVRSPLSLFCLVLPFWLLLLYLVGKKGLMRDEADGRIAWGIVWFPMAYLVLLGLHEPAEQRYGIIFPMLVLAICDPLATVVGKCLAKRQYQLTGDPKSLVGSLAFLLGFLLLSWAFSWPGPWTNLLAVAMMVSAAEALGSEGLDNLYIPLLTAFLWWCNELHGLLFAPLLPLLLLSGLAFLAIRLRLLTLGGAVAAAMLGMIILLSLGPRWLWPLLFFFGSSVLISQLLPNRLPSDEKANKARDHLQVMANGGPYGFICLLIVVYSFVKGSGILATPHPFYLLLWVSAAAATADTWSSEIGKYIGGATFDLLRWKPVKAGLSGGVSWQGTLAGWLGAAAVAALYWLVAAEEASGKSFFIISSFGFLGMLLDSLLGSGLQRQYFDGWAWKDSPGSQDVAKRGWAWMSNDMVNLLANLGTLLLAFLYLFLIG